ncbi:MAG: hypothetical protein Q8P59_05175 [Dehalococcoidia bacterium]|nr:hypothetical protein [Dehalococcoidia bacterium]
MEELDTMTAEELKAELERTELELADLDEERHAFLGQTGVHIGVALLRSRRRQYEREEEALRGRIAAIKAQLDTQ